jgi:hypothetical protein
MHVHIITHHNPIINILIRIYLKYMHVYIFRAKIDLTASIGAAYLKLLG